MEETFRCGTIAIVGRPNVGKSTLLNALVGQKLSITSRKPQTTRHRLLGILTRAETQFIFVDTPGFQTRHGGSLNRMLNKNVQRSLQDIDAVMWVVEAGTLSEQDRKVAQLLPTDIPAVMVVNKTDRIGDRADPDTPTPKGKPDHEPRDRCHPRHSRTARRRLA